MNIPEQLVNKSKILYRKLHNIPKCIPRDISSKDYNRYYIEKKSQGQMSETPREKKLEYSPTE